MITAVDVGATKTLVAQMHHGIPAEVTKFLTSKSEEEFLAHLTEELDKLKGTTAISVGVPGLVDDDGAIIRCANLPWKHFALTKMLADRYNCPVYIDNDSKLAGLAEINALPHVPRVGLCVAIGTGIGVGVILEGKLLRPLHFSESGHMILYFDGELREWEDFAAGKPLVAHFGKQVQELNTMEEWDEVARRIGIGMHALIPAFQPEVVVFSGGVGAHFQRFRATLEKEIRAHLSPMITMPEMRAAVHAKEAVLYGCYYNAKDK